jgi:protocatechuate 3,4-dioxygenase alpha subunit
MAGLTPSQTVGPFFHIVLPRPDLTAVADDGALVDLVGAVRDGAGDPVADALVEVWQADEEGRYPHPEDQRGQECRPGFRGFARAATDGAGRYRLRIVKPGAVASLDGGRQAPHLAVSVFARGLLDRVCTRAYFSDETTANAADPVLISVPQERRPLLLAAAAADGGWEFDIRLQGGDETPFFDV